MMKSILLWDLRFPDRDPLRLTLADEIASAAVRAGVAAAADPAEAGALAQGGALSGADPIDVVLQHGVANERQRRVRVPLSVAQVAAGLGYAAGVDTVIAADAAGYDVIVLAGQSNMVGRNGPIDGVLDATDPRILMYGFNAQAVALAQDPLDHQDEGANTIGMGLTFAKAHLATMPANRSVLLVPVAKGGTAFNTGFWRAGGGGDAPAIARTNAAMAQGAGVNRLVAVLWHQGESDQAVTQAQYEADLDALIARWRAGMTGATAATPFVCGGLLVGGTQTAAGVSAALLNTPIRVSHAGYAASTGLVSGGDNLHFSAASQRTLAARYFAAFQAAKSSIATPQAPAAITNLAATAGDGQVALTWSAPSGNGSAITDYVIEYKTSAGSVWGVFADSASATTGVTVTGLTNATAYDFRVKAVNAIGTGAASNVASATPAAAGGAGEAAALRHWLFGTDNSTMADLKAGEVLTPVTTAPVQASGYMTMGGQNKGARSAQTDASAMTIIVVARWTAAGAMIVGNVSATAGDGGIGIYGQTTSDVRMMARPTSDTLTTAYTLGQWRFLALSVANGVSRVDYMGDATAPTVKESPTIATSFTKSPANALLGVGDCNYNSVSFAAPCDVAEFMIFNAALTLADIQAIYARSVTRLAARGVTVS
jgi:hypothetical protein